LKVLVTGAKGQLGIDVVERLSQSYEVIGLDREKLDITSLDRVVNIVKEIKPDIIINTAAYTNVDGCEMNIDTAYKINAVGPRNLAVAALEYNIRLLHLSTDFVFDGEKREPYVEFDRTNPLGVYGKSKLAGEDLVREICPRHYILRTSWLYGINGKNFIKTMLKLSETNNIIKVVDDQVGSPTFTVDLVKVIEMVMKTDAYGIYHASNSGQCSWNQFAKKIFERAGKTDVEVLPITSVELNRPAMRPKYSVMSNLMIKLQFDYCMRNWDEALMQFFAKP
jgi:dTDP-4-dehydrorhamnose reductase